MGQDGGGCLGGVGGERMEARMKMSSRMRRDKDNGMGKTKEEIHRRLIVINGVMGTMDLRILVASENDTTLPFLCIQIEFFGCLRICFPARKVYIAISGGYMNFLFPASNMARGKEPRELYSALYACSVRR
jgi:hypothetical protein